MTTLTEIGTVLREARLRAKLSQVELAQQARISRSSLSGLENGIGNVELNTLLSLLQVLGMDLQLIATAVAPLAGADRELKLTGLQAQLAGLTSGASGRSNVMATAGHTPSGAAANTPARTPAKKAARVRRAK